MVLSTAIAMLDWLTVTIFAVTGALIASRKQMDVVGFVLLGTVTGIGGGTLRYLLLGFSPVFWVKEPAYLIGLSPICSRRSASRDGPERLVDIVWAAQPVGLEGEAERQRSGFRLLQRQHAPLVFGIVEQGDARQSRDDLLEDLQTRAVLRPNEGYPGDVATWASVAHHKLLQHGKGDVREHDGRGGIVHGRSASGVAPKSETRKREPLTWRQE